MPIFSVLSDLDTSIGLVCETILYGNCIQRYCFSATHSNRHQCHSFSCFQKRHQIRLTNLVVLLNCLIFLCCITHVVLEFYHFLTYPVYFQPYSALSLSDRSWTATNWYRYFWVGDHTLVGADVLGEVILIYRFWSLYEKNTRVIIIPCLATFGGLGNVPNPHHCSINHICTACIGVVVHFIFWPSPSLFINPFSPFPS